MIDTARPSDSTSRSRVQPRDVRVRWVPPHHAARQYRLQVRQGQRGRQVAGVGGGRRANRQLADLDGLGLDGLRVRRHVRAALAVWRGAPAAGADA